jgi:hypothetical protein
MPAAASAMAEASMDYPVASCSAPVSVATGVNPKHKSQIPAASRRPPWCGEAIKRQPASLTFGVCAADPATSTFNSRLPRNVIAGRLRASQFSETAMPVSAQLCQEHVRPLFFSLAPSRERRLNAFVGNCGVSRRCGKNTYIGDGRENPADPTDIKPEAATGDGRP